MTFDPQADGTLLDKEAEVEGADDLSVNTREEQSQSVVWPQTYTFFSSYEKDNNDKPIDPTDLNFSALINTSGSGLNYIRDMYFKLVGLLGGSDASGVLGFFIHKHSTIGSSPGNMTGFIRGSKPQANRVLMRTERFYIPPISQRLASDKRYMLRLKLDILADPRYNPFEDGESDNEGDNYDAIKNRCGLAMAPASVRLYDAKTGGNVLWHYDNRSVASRYSTDSSKKIGLSGALGSWSKEYGGGVDDTTTAGAHCWLSWYDKSAKDDRDDTQAIFGWKTNSQTIGFVEGKLRADISEIPSGQYIPYPPDGGWLEITIWEGLAIIDKPSLMSDGVNPYPIANIATRCIGTQINSEWNVFPLLRWLLYKAPKIDIVWGRGDHDTISIDEIVTEREALTGAEDELELDLTCGTVGKDVPSARGQIYRIATLLPLRKLTRGGVTDTPEQLLARTMCAQYGRRQTTLSGEAAIRADEPHLWTDANRVGNKMLMLGESQNLIEDTTEVELCDVVQDAAADGYTVTTDLENCTSDAPSNVRSWAAPLQVTLTPNSTYYVVSNSVVVTMGGVDITESAYDSTTKVISIARVTGDVVITARAEQATTETFTPTYLTTPKKRINTDGTVSSSSNFTYTSPVQVKAGDVLTYVCSGYNSSTLATLSLTDAYHTYYTCVYDGTGQSSQGATKTRIYTVVSDGYVAFSYYTSKGLSVSITRTTIPT